MNGIELRDDGMALVERNNKKWFDRALTELAYMRSNRAGRLHAPFTFENILPDLEYLIGSKIPAFNLAGSIMMNAIKKGYVEATGKVIQTTGELKHARKAMLYNWAIK